MKLVPNNDSDEVALWRLVARNKAPAREAEQLYSLAEVARLLGVPSVRLSALAMVGKFPAAAVIVPGGGHKGRRWSASQLHELLRAWAIRWRSATTDFFHLNRLGTITRSIELARSPAFGNEFRHPLFTHSPHSIEPLPWSPQT